MCMSGGPLCSKSPKLTGCRRCLRVGLGRYFERRDPPGARTFQLACYILRLTRVQIWKSRWTAAKVIYLFARYWTLVTVPYILWCFCVDHDQSTCSKVYRVRSRDPVLMPYLVLTFLSLVSGRSCYVEPGWSRRYAHIPQRAASVNRS